MGEGWKFYNEGVKSKFVLLSFISKGLKQGNKSKLEPSN